MTDTERIARLLERLDAAAGQDSGTARPATFDSPPSAADAEGARLWTHAQYARRLLKQARVQVESEQIDPARRRAGADALMAALAAEPTPVRAAAAAPVLAREGQLGAPSHAHLVAPPPTDVDERQWDLAGDDDGGLGSGTRIPLPHSRPGVTPLPGRIPAAQSGMWAALWGRLGFGGAARLQPVWLGYAVATLAVVAAAPYLARLLPRDPVAEPVAEPAPLTDPVQARELARLMAAPSGNVYPMEVLAPGALAQAEGFVSAADIPLDRRGFGLYRRHLRTNSAIVTEPDTALGLRVDPLSVMEIREDSRVQADKLTDYRKPFVVVRGSVVVRIQGDTKDPTAKSSLVVSTPYLRVEPTDESVRTEGGLFFAVAFDQDNRSIVEVGRGSVRLATLDGRLNRIAQGGERVSFHPSDGRFVLAALAKDRMRQAARPRALPKADALAMLRGLPFLGDETDVKALMDAEFDTPQRKAPETPPSGPQPADQKGKPALAGGEGAVAAPVFPKAPPRDAAGNTWGHGEMMPPAKTDPDAGLFALDEARRRQVERLYATVQADMDAGNYDEALQRLSLFLQGTPGPESERGWYLKGLCLDRLGRRKDRNEAWFNYVNRFPQGHWAAEATKGITQEPSGSNDADSADPGRAEPPKAAP